MCEGQETARCAQPLAKQYKLSEYNRDSLPFFFTTLLYFRKLRIVMDVFITSFKNSILVCQNCHNKIPLTRWYLTQQKFIVPQFWRPKAQDQGCWRGRRSLRAMGDSLCMPLPVSGGLLVVFGIIWLPEHHCISAFIFTSHSPCVTVCVQISPSYESTSHTGLGASSTAV